MISDESVRRNVIFESYAAFCTRPKFAWYGTRMNAAAAAEVLTAEPITAAPAVTSGPTTFEAWANMDEDEPGEFVDGRIVEEEVASHVHEIIVSWLTGTLRTWGRPRGYPVYGSEHKLRVALTRGRKPDLCMYAQGTRMRNASFSSTPPMLVVEVVSPSPRDVKRDRLEKRHEYAKFGVQHYWLVDPAARMFDFFVLATNGRWTESAGSASEGRVEVAGFDGLVLDLDDLWSEVDSIIETDDEIIKNDEP